MADIRNHDKTDICSKKCLSLQRIWCKVTATGRQRRSIDRRIAYSEAYQQCSRPPACLSISITDHPQSSVIYAFGRVCLSVCLYVCQTITFESLDVGRSFLLSRYISRAVQGTRVKFGYEGHQERSRSQEPKRYKISIAAM